MKMVIFPNDRKKALKLSINLWGCVAALAAVGALSACLYNLTVGTYLEKRAVAGELQVLEDVRSDTETALNAMAGRVSLLQSHVMRLDALGSRLAEMAQVDDIEFGIEHPPGLGGPHDLLDDSSRELTDYEFLISLNRLEQALEDRQDKLSAMETLLMGRSLRDSALPHGNPAKGGWFSSLFGYRTNPISGNEEFHLGVDLAGRTGMAVTSIASGIVTWSGPNQGYGNMVEISHGNGYVTRYAHNKENLVNVGERVEKGQIIAIMGSTGRSTGAHVHFEVVRNGRHINPRSHISLH